jgi:RNA polymerase sigma-70 factor (ECF subfamily)
MGSMGPDATRALLEERDRFRSFLHRRVGSRDVAEEILQEAYAKAFERGGQLRDDESAVAWFFRILRNAVVERARRQAAAASALERFAKEMEEGSRSEEVEQAVCSCVVRVLETLKPEYRDSVRAVDVDSRELREFAAEAGITPNNAAVRLHRARAALGKRLQETCGACAEHGCVDCTCKATAVGGTPRSGVTENER